MQFNNHTDSQMQFRNHSDSQMQFHNPCKFSHLIQFYSLDIFTSVSLNMCSLDNAKEEYWGQGKLITFLHYVV